MNLFTKQPLLAHSGWKTFNGFKQAGAAALPLTAPRCEADIRPLSLSLLKLLKWSHRQGSKGSFHLPSPPSGTDGLPSTAPPMARGSTGITSAMKLNHIVDAAESNNTTLEMLLSSKWDSKSLYVKPWKEGAQQCFKPLLWFSVNQ